LNEPMPQSVLDLQVKGLLERVAHYQEKRCAELRAASDAQSRQILASARAEALANVRSATSQERTRIEQGLRQAQAHAQLEARQHAQQDVQQLLTSMWSELPGALEARWHRRDDRHTWIMAAITEAGALFAERAWHIEHGPGWQEMEDRELEELARAHGARSAEAIADPSLGAGLRIRAAGVCLDSTITGLLARREEIESAFLAQYSSSQGDGGIARD